MSQHSSPSGRPGRLRRTLVEGVMVLGALAETAALVAMLSAAPGVATPSTATTEVTVHVDVHVDAGCRPRAEPTGER